MLILSKSSASFIFNVKDSNRIIGEFIREKRSVCKHGIYGADRLYKSPRCRGVSVGTVDYTHCQDMSRDVSLACFLSGMKHVAFYPIAFVGVCVC